MSVNTITPQLLQALMSPNGDFRSQAEAVYQSISVLDRIQGLLQHLLLSSSDASSSSSSSSSSIALLTAVLLRRDIVKLSSSQHLQELMAPLLQVFQTPPNPQVPGLATPVGHCLAQIGASLALVDPNAAPGAVTTILTALQSSLGEGHVPSLKVLGALAEQAPVAFSQVAVDSLPQLYPSSSNNHNWSVAAKQVWMQVLVQAAIATMSLPSSSSSSSALLTAAAANPKNLDDWRIDSESRAAKLGPSLLPLLEWLAAAATSSSTSMMTGNDSDATVDMLQHLAQAAVSCPSLLAGNVQVLTTCVQTCLQLATTFAGTDDIAISLAALQVLSSVVSVGDIKRRCLPAPLVSAIATTALPLCVQLMVDHAGNTQEEDSQWAATPATLVEEGMDEDEELDEFLFASMLLESFLSQLGSMALSQLLPLAEQLLQPSQTTGRQRVGLVVLEIALTATPVSLTHHLPVLLQAATSLANNNGQQQPPIHRLRYHALRLLGTLCVTHSEQVLQNSSARVVLESLVGALTSNISKVSVVASLGLVSFCRRGGGGGGGNVTSSGDHSELVVQALQPFLGEVLSRLTQGPLSWSGMDPGSIAVRVRAMGAVACLAQASSSGDDGESVFRPYYSQVMPGLVATSQLPSVELASAALEAATIVGQAVGKDAFQGDAHQWLQSWILPALQQQPNSPLVEPLLLACARMASVLQEEFAPYATVVVPVLLSRVQTPPDMSIVEGDEAGLNAEGDDGDGTESMTVAVPGRGFTKVTINTTKMQEKAQATRALYEHAKAMGEAFGPHVEACLEALVPLVNFPYSADVRSTSAQTLGAVFDVACLVGEESGMGLVRQYLPLLVKSISSQIVQEDTSDMEALYALADSLSEIYYIAYRYRSNHPEVFGNFGLANAQESVEACMTTMVACLDRRSQTTQVLQGGALAGEDEQQDYLEQLQAEQQLLTPLVDSVGYCLKVFRQDFLPVFEQYVVPVLRPKLASQEDVRASLSAICLFDDVVEHCGTDAAAKYAPLLLPGVVTALEQHLDEKEMVQAAAYGVAQMARYAPSSVFSAHNTQIIVHRLLAVTSRNKEETENDAYLLEVAASALASLTLLGPFPELKFVPRDTLVNSFLSQLPILQDDDEAKICHAGLCRLIETGAVALDQEAGRITRIIGTILVEVQQGEDVATSDTVERMSSILFQMQQGLGPSTLQQALGSLEPEAQQAVAMVLQDMRVSRAHVVTP